MLKLLIALTRLNSCYLSFDIFNILLLVSATNLVNIFGVSVFPSLDTFSHFPSYNLFDSINYEYHFG